MKKRKQKKSLCLGLNEINLIINDLYDKMHKEKKAVERKYYQKILAIFEKERNSFISASKKLPKDKYIKFAINLLQEKIDEINTQIKIKK